MRLIKLYCKALYPDLQRQYRQEVEAVEVGEGGLSSHAPSHPPTLSLGVASDYQ